LAVEEVERLRIRLVQADLVAAVLPLLDQELQDKVLREEFQQVVLLAQAEAVLVRLGQITLKVVITTMEALVAQVQPLQFLAVL
jgi:hypothetical protein